MDKEIKFNEILKDNRIIGLVGNPNTSKTSLALSRLIELKKGYPTLKIYVFGVSELIMPYLTSNGIDIIYNKEDILDLKIKGSIIYIDEFGDFFSVNSKDKQLERVKRFFNRIYHLNDWFILSTAQAGFWNKFMCGLVNCFLVKEVEYDNLVNGTTLKRWVTGICSYSDYRLEIPKNTYYVLTNKLSNKCTFEYNSSLDSKKDLVNFFEKAEKFYGEKDGKKKMNEKMIEDEKKDELKAEKNYETD